MSDIDALLLKQEKIYQDCCEINNCSECFHDNGNGHKDCDLTLISREIDEISKIK